MPFLNSFDEAPDGQGLLASRCQLLKPVPFAGTARLSRRISRGRGMSAQPVVQVEDLNVYYGTSQILFGVGLSVRQGETMALLGRNGAGKSTTMRAIMGLAPARRGRVTLTLSHRASWPRLRARGSSDLSRLYGRGQSRYWPEEGPRGPNGRSGVSMTCFRCWNRCDTGLRDDCQAANNRCLRLHAR